MFLRHFIFVISALAVFANAVIAQKPPCRVALVQTRIAWGDVDKNISAFGSKVKECSGCDIVILPELFASGCEMKKSDRLLAREKKKDIAARFDDVVRAMKQWAGEVNATIAGSTIYMDGENFYNRLIVAHADGRTEYYDKHNCFKKGSFTPGDEPLVFDVGGWKFAAFICYDLRFPAWNKMYGHYDVAMYVANWPESRRGDWISLLRERAVDNGCYSAGVNCIGTSPGGKTYSGDSMIISPDGESVASCGEYEDTILFYDLVDTP